MNLLFILIMIITIVMAILLSIPCQTILILLQLMYIIDNLNDLTFKKLNYKVVIIDYYQTMIVNIVEIEIMIIFMRFNLYLIQMIKWLLKFYFKIKKMTTNDKKLTLKSRLKIGNISLYTLSYYTIETLAFQTMMIVKSIVFIEKIL